MVITALFGVLLCTTTVVAENDAVGNDATVEYLLTRIADMEVQHAADMEKMNQKLQEAQLKLTDLQNLSIAVSGEASSVTSEDSDRSNLSTNGKRASGRALGDGKIAFTAYLNHDQNQIGTNQPIRFNKILINDGNGYSNYTGAFTAPEPGVYYFTFFVGERNVNQLFVSLVKNNALMVDAVVETIQSSHDAQGGNSAALLLNQGDVVFVQHHGSTNGDHLEGSKSLRVSTFSGFLLYRSEDIPSFVGK